MTGAFSLIITAFGGDNYDFESFEIVIIVTQHPFELPIILIPGYNLFTLICIISVLTIIIVRKLLRKKQRVQNLKKEK